MRACIAAIIIVACSPWGLAHAQSGTDVSPAIPVHPDVPTILQLPEKVERSWIHYGDDFRVKGVGREVYLRPRPGTPAGTEALLEVKTGTLHRIFLLRVVARAGDARREVVVPAAPDVACVEQAGREAPAVAPTPAEPAACAPSPAPVPDEPAPAPAAPEPIHPAPTDAPDNERAAAATVPPRYDLSAHAVAGLGFTGLEIAGYRPHTSLQGHHTLGLRLVGAPRGHWLSLEAGVSAEWPAGSMTFKQPPAFDLEVTGARFRGEVGLRASAGTKWLPSVYAGIGLQAHLRRIVETSSSRGPETVTTLARGAVLVLGLGLQHRAGSTLLGLDFQVRQGGPDDYFSVAAFLTLGRILDQGE